MLSVSPRRTVMEMLSCSIGCDNDKALCTLKCRFFDGAGRVVCRQCINAMVTLTGKLKCHICRVEVEKFNFTQTVNVATLQRKRNCERAALGLDAGTDDRDEEELEEPRWFARLHLVCTIFLLPAAQTS